MGNLLLPEETVNKSPCVLNIFVIL